jgi:hypothetical protein
VVELVGLQGKRAGTANGLLISAITKAGKGPLALGVMAVLAFQLKPSNEYLNIINPCR